MRNIVINADDYAMDAGIDAATLQLAAKGVIGAASAMVLSPRWPEAARRIQDAPTMSWGLHLDLTSDFAGVDGKKLGLMALMVRAGAGLIDGNALRREVSRQLSLFETGRRAAPHFVDGHQHVHHLPGVRDILMDALDDRYGEEKKRIALRICLPRRWRGVKAAIIGATGASGFAKRASVRGHPINSDFAGVYDFGAGANLAANWQGWTNGLSGPLPLIMCHVATNCDDDGRDPIRQARLREFQWLASEEFQRLLRERALSCTRWPTP